MATSDTQGATSRGQHSPAEERAAYTRRFGAAEAAANHKGEDVAAQLEWVIADRGAPAVIQSDNGSEFTGRTLDLWAYGRGVRLDFSRPGKPTDNAVIESFHRRLREECLSQHSCEAACQARAACTSMPPVIVPSRREVPHTPVRALEGGARAADGHAPPAQGWLRGKRRRHLVYGLACGHNVARALRPD